MAKDDPREALISSLVYLHDQSEGTWINEQCRHFSNSIHVSR